MEPSSNQVSLFTSLSFYLSLYPPASPSYGLAISGGIFLRIFAASIKFASKLIMNPIFLPFFNQQNLPYGNKVLVQTLKLQDFENIT